MDEHDKRAREWYAQELNEQPSDCPCYEQHIEALATLLRSTAAAAVAAERERCARVCDEDEAEHSRHANDPHVLEPVAHAHRASAITCASLAVRIRVASPAQAERVSEEGWAANAERQLTRNGGWHVPGYSEDEHEVRFETVTDAHARGCRETQVRIAARLRATADGLSARGPAAHYAATVLRAEADALEVGT